MIGSFGKVTLAMVYTGWVQRGKFEQFLKEEYSEGS